MGGRAAPETFRKHFRHGYETTHAADAQRGPFVTSTENAEGAVPILEVGKGDELFPICNVSRACRLPYRRRVGSCQVYEVRPRPDSCGFYLISDALPGGRLAFEKQRVAAGYARLHSGSNGILIKIFDAEGNNIATHEECRAPAALAS